MAEDPKAPEPGPDDSEKAFWEKFTANLDAWWDNKMKTYRESKPAGTSRTGGKRATLPDVIADFVFGPPKD